MGVTYSKLGAKLGARVISLAAVVAAGPAWAGGPPSLTHDPLPPYKPNSFFSGTNFIAAPPPTYLTFTSDKGPVSINLKDGSVKMPEGLAIDDASRAFWTALKSMYPGLCQPHPSTSR